MKLAVKWNLSAAKKKLRGWMQKADEQMMKDVQLYGKTAAVAMVKSTPPSNGRSSPAKALKALRERIREDFEGGGLEPFTDADVEWFTTPDGVKRAYIARSKRTHLQPSPFRVVSGAVDAAVLRGLNVGKYKVLFVGGNLGKFMAEHRDQYYMTMRKKVWRMRWVGVRHVTTEAAVREEIRRRQFSVGALMNGWDAMAKKVGYRMPGMARRGGKGSCKVTRGAKGVAHMTGTNSGHYPGLQRIVDRQVPGIVRKNRKLAKKRTAELAAKLRK